MKVFGKKTFLTVNLLDRKLRLKRTIQVRAISSKLADIPPDDYSWRKYGQKPIKGSPHPRYFLTLTNMHVKSVMC